ncbi:MAG: extracellular solute-binding protein [Eubacteriales bacterium]|nr:extracellular solute-binding protein [Eubacteriales bacterium]
MPTKTKRQRIIIFALAFSMLLPFGLTGCKTGENAVKTKIKHVYKAEFIEMPEEALSLDRLFMSDGKLYFTGYSHSEEKSQNLLYSMNQDGSDLTELLTFDSNESYMTALTMLPDGTIWTVFNSYTVNEETGEYSENFAMIKYAADGTEQSNLDLKDIITDREHLYINSLTADSKGNLYFVIEDSVYILDSDAKPKHTAKIENGYINTVKVDASDNVFIIYNDNTSYKTTVKKLDPDTGSLSDILSLGSASNFAYSMTTGGEGSSYDFYYNNSVALCGFRFDTLESVELCNWINSDVNGNQIGAFLVVNDDKIICTVYDETDYKQKLIVLNRVPEEQVVEKYILTLAGIYVDYNTRSAIIAFNRANKEYRITIKDYSVYNTDEDYEQGLTALNNDIIAGNIPDIIQVGYNMPTDSYIAKGLFADLNEYIEKDESIDRSEYLENVFDAMSVNGRLYELTPAFSIRTVSGKQSVVGSASGWTMDEFNAVLDKYPDAKAFYDVTQSAMLENICTITVDQFIDKNSGKCSFDSDGFIQILEFAKTLSDKSVWEMENGMDMGEDYWTQMQNAHYENRVLLQVEYFNSFRQYWELMQGTYGEEINFIGFPTDNRNGSAISPSFKLAMSAKTKLSEGAWQFMRYFLTDEYQDTITYDFPVKLSRLEALAVEAMKPYSWTDEATGEVHEYPSTWWIGNESIEIGEITREYVDVVMNFIRSLNQVVRNDTDMMEIINEEAAAFFAGSKSAEETAKIIQNRVSIYVSESR